MGLARALSGLIQADCGLRTARTTDRIGCFQVCTSSARTRIVPACVPYGTYLQGILTGSCVHVAKTPGRPLTALMHLTTSSQGYVFPSLAYNRSFEAYSSMCRRPLHELYWAKVLTDHPKKCDNFFVIEYFGMTFRTLNGDSSATVT